MSADIQPEPKHRNDLDGLRGVAVLPVLFYHAGIWPFFGGYVGVDVFFVLSGYLITGLILREYDAGRFSFAAFYDRRIRRILPALGAMLLVATLVAPFILLPDELSHYGTSLLGAVLSCANIFDWLRGAAYFAPLAGENPLLHVWSLSVEEQFYLLWPVLLVALARLRRLLPWAILALAALSLAMALAAAGTDPNAAFYLLPARAWQILLGALLAAGGAAPPSNVIARNGVAAAGAVLIAAAAVFSDATLLYHPWNALAAALGAAAILHASDGGPTLVGAALATRVPVFVGRISYSLYLWHWPALAFSRLFVGRSLSPLEASAVLVAVVPVAVLSWRYIEQPIRWRRWTWRA
ncbi:MAG TPA: acyltransferase [Rhizomicrobium sp.]